MLAEKIYLEEQQYELKNLLLAYPSDWFLNKETLEKAKASLPNIVDFYKSGGLEDPKESFLKSLISEPLKDVYTVPLFSEKFCQILLDEINNMQKHFALYPKPR